MHRNLERNGPLNTLLILLSRSLAVGLVGLLVIQSVWAQEAAQSFELETADGITVFGDIYEPEHVKRPPLILAFHQGGGDARGEYTPIIPTLVRQGFAVMIIDQRRGGEVFGGTNRTVAALPEGADYSYCDAYPDLEAALAFARTQSFGRIIAWGSSYSATLALQLASEYPTDLDRVIAFSPASGEPMGDCQPREYAAQITIPALMIRPEREAAIESVADDLTAFSEMGHDVFISPGGSHGSSVLVEERSGNPATEAWERILSFLNAGQ